MSEALAGTDHDQIELGSSLIKKLWSRTLLLWTIVAVAFFLSLGAPSTAHAHVDQGKRLETTTQIFVETLDRGQPQGGQGEAPTCHHGAVPCSTSYSMSNADLAGAPRSTNTVPFSVITGFPLASFFTIDPPPPKL